MATKIEIAGIAVPEIAGPEGFSINLTKPDGKRQKYPYYDISFKRSGEHRHRQVQIAPAIGDKAIKKAINDARVKVQAKIKELEKWYADLTSGRSPQIPFDTALEKYIHEELYGNKPGGKQQKSARAVAAKLVRLTEFTAGRKLSEIVEIAKEYSEREDARGMKAGTINVALAHLKRLAKVSYDNWKHKDGRRYLDDRAYMDVKNLPGGKVVRKAPKYFLTYRDIIAIMDACPEQEMKDFILVSLATGMRRAEVGRISAPRNSKALLRTFNHNGTPVREEPYTVDFKNMLIHLPDQKNGDEDVSIPIIPQAVEALKRFPLTRGTQWHYRHLSAAAESIGLYAYVHMLRKSCGNILHYELGVPIDIVAMILRNGPEVARLHYTGRGTEKVRETLTNAFTTLDERMRLSKKADEDNEVA